ncbi:MAG: GNAT family N-acyltransferase [Candidatus Sulfotelmatobacter sp.]
MRRLSVAGEVRYVIARKSEDLQTINELLRSVYINERGWLPPDYSNILEDKYHPHSSYILAINKETGIGCMRIVSDSAVGLPIEQFFPLAPLKETQRFVESQRMMVLPEYRNAIMNGAPYGMWAGLVKACIQYCFVNKISHVFADLFTDPSTGPMVRKFRALGFQQIGVPFHDTELGARGQSVAMLLTVSQFLSRAYASRDALFNYLLEFDTAFEFYPEARPASRDPEPALAECAEKLVTRKFGS